MSCNTTDPLQRQAIQVEIDQMEEAIGLASDDKVTERNRLKRYLRILARPCRIEEIRAALSDIDLLAPGNEPQLGRYLDVCRGLRLPWKVI